MKRNAFQFRRANEEDLPEICRIVKLAGEIVPVKEWFEAEDEEFLAKHIREEGFTLLAKKNGQTAAIMIVRIPGLAEDNLGEYLKISRKEMKRVAHLYSRVDAVKVVRIQQRVKIVKEQPVRRKVQNESLRIMRHQKTFLQWIPI